MEFNDDLLMQEVTVTLPGYNTQVLTPNELSFIIQLLDMYELLPNMTQFIFALCNNNVCRPVLSTFEPLTEVVKTMSDRRLSELCVFAVRMSNYDY